MTEPHDFIFVLTPPPFVKIQYSENMTVTEHILYDMQNPINNKSTDDVLARLEQILMNKK
jgi:hypothetical protein